MQTVERWLRGVALAAAALAALSVVTMVLLIVAEVILRSFFGYSLMLIEEYSGYLVMCVLALGISLTFLDGEMLRVDVIIRTASRNAQRRIQLFYDFICLLFAATITYYFAVFAFRSYIRGIVAPTQIATPTFLPQSIMALGFFLLTVCLAWKLLAGLRPNNAKDAGELPRRAP